MANNMARNAHHEIRQHDTQPRMATVFRDEDGNPVDVSGLTIKVYVLNKAGNTVVQGDGTIDDAVNGAVAYDWADGDTAFADQYKVLWRATDGSGNSRTHPVSGHEQLTIHPSPVNP